MSAGVLTAVGVTPSVPLLLCPLTFSISSCPCFSWWSVPGVLCLCTAPLLLSGDKTRYQPVYQSFQNTIALKCCFKKPGNHLSCDTSKCRVSHGHPFQQSCQHLSSSRFPQQSESEMSRTCHCSHLMGSSIYNLPSSANCLLLKCTCFL